MDETSSFFNALLSYETLVTGITVAVVTFLGNLIFFHYKKKKERKSKILEQQLKELLLPLLFIFEDYRFKVNKIHDHNPGDFDVTEHIIYEPKEVVGQIHSLLKEKLYLSNTELHNKCLKFLHWASVVDTEEEWDNLYMRGVLGYKEVEDFKNFVTQEYEKTKNEYLQ